MRLHVLITNCLSLLNGHIHNITIGVTDTGATLGPKKAPEREEETEAVPPRLEEWTAEGVV